MLELKIDGKVIKMEHSLVSISKWESVFKRPYLIEQVLQPEERLFYYDCMMLDDSLEFLPLLKGLEESEIVKMTTIIDNYINQPRTATTVSSDSDGVSMIYTSEVIYSMMAITGLDVSCETWHISRLLITLAVIADLKSEKKQMPQSEVVDMQARLNEERRRKYQSKG